MGFDEVTFFGTIVKTHGIKGHLVLRCYDNFKCKKNNPVFLFFREGDLLKQAAVSEILFTYPFCRIKFADNANGKEVLIPLNKNFITRFNSTENNLVVTLPDGLLDIYLQ